MSVLDSELVEGRPKHGITIGQLADYAGVTIKAVRHYHKRGLLEEPPRDASRYRRYTARHALDLVKIKTLAEAGVPLVRIKELLAADPDAFRRGHRRDRSQAAGTASGAPTQPRADRPTQRR